jgi:tRNA wybutosine-synthesizing protein 1
LADVLTLWHDYRSSILVAIAVSLVLFRTIAIWRDRRINELQETVSTPDEKPVLGIPRIHNSAQVSDNGSKGGLGPRRVVGKKRPRPTRDVGAFGPSTNSIQPYIFFFSLGGTTEAVSKDFAEDIGRWTESLNSPCLISKPKLLDLSYIEYDDYFLSTPKDDPNAKSLYLILIPTYNIDTSLNPFLEHLQETHHDFRIDTAPLAKILGYSVFGFGDKEGWPTEEEGFCSQARDVDKWMAKLTARKRAFPVGMGDSKSDWRERLTEWTAGIKEVMIDLKSVGGLGEGIPGSGNAEESDVEGDAEIDSEMTGDKKRLVANLDDVEDLGSTYRGNQTSTSGPIPIDFTTYEVTKSVENSLKEMVPKASPTYTSLTKQGYTIVGSHSGVKICRWTKSALRGRGSCYKFSFYGIKSHLCMETTPSLSCSNKCVFCWRHGTNPVGTVWRWRVDPPEMIFDGVKEGHYKKIKMLKGVPGVRAERFAEAMRIRHCALSLVGEPIFYPHINKFLGLLHKEHISSFLVCNAQHPDQLAALDHVTQLYVSIDASNKESLKKIDRPLHRDFWERFQRCLDILRENRFRQRTVFRLTLVKGFNIADEVEGYADLVAKGLPCFVEVKGVTFCGTSTSAGAGLTMQNVPFHEEVCEFVRALTTALDERGLGYGIAAEHAHSCCILIASTRFKINGHWHTLIDYDKFFQCLESGKEFGPEDYVGEPTPEWAMFGNGGFDPNDERHYRKKGKKQTD